MKLTVTLATLAIFLGSSFGRAEMVTRTRTVVDTVTAMNIIKEKYEMLNQPHVLKIQSIDSDIKYLDAKIKVNNDSIKTLEDLLGDIAPKVKEKDKIVKISLYLSSSIDKLPIDSIYAYCKEKDLQKARSKEQREVALTELRRKTKEKILNKAAKGDFSSGFANGCISYFYDRSKAESEHLSALRKYFLNDREIEESMLKKVPTFFTADLWLTNMGGKEVPTKEITECRERFGADDLSFQELIEKYSNHPVYRDAIRNPGDDHSLFIKGRFDGIIKDRIGVFPVESSRIIDSDFEESFRRYNQIMLISEKGTVAPLILSYPKELGTDGYYGYYVDVNGYWLNSLTDIWSVNGLVDKRDGLSVFAHPEGSTIDSEYTFVVENGKWVNKSPLNPDYLSFDECREILKEKMQQHQIKVLEFNYKVLEDYGDHYDYYGDGSSVNLLPFINTMIAEDKNNVEKKLYIKSKSLNKGEEGFVALPNLILNADNLYNVVVEKDFWSPGDDALIVIYKKENTDKPFYDLEYYRISWGALDFAYINGLGIDYICYWEKWLEGTYNQETGENDIQRIEKSTENY